MASEFGDLTVFDHADPVGVVRGVQAVGDRDDGAPGDDGRERPLEVAGGPRVEQ